MISWLRRHEKILEIWFSAAGGVFILLFGLTDWGSYIWSGAL